MTVIQNFESVGYHYTKIKGVYSKFLDKNKPCHNSHCQCGGSLYHSYTRHDYVVCEDCGLTYIVLLIRDPRYENKIRQ